MIARLITFKLAGSQLESGRSSATERQAVATRRTAEEKESARAEEKSLAATRKGRTRRYSATPKLVTFLLFSARQYGVADL